MRRKRWGLLTVLLLGLATPTRAWAEEVWGYLWEVRTQRLHPLKGEVIRVGRLLDSQVVLTHPMVSRRHLEIRKTGEGAVVVDLRSTNGTRLNRRALRAGREAPLRAGDLLELAQDKLLFHRTKLALWEGALDHSLLARFVVLQVPVLQDRIRQSLGRKRTILGVSRAVVDLDGETIQMGYSDETQPSAFRPGDTVFVSDVAVADAELRLSLWGVGRGGPLTSRRAAFSHVVHGELRVGLAGSSPEEARSHFEVGWADEGMGFLVRLLIPVLQVYSEAKSAKSGLKLARNLAEQPDPLALKDAARSLGFLSRLNPTDSELPILVARAETRWVKAVALENRRGLDDTRRSELEAALERSKAWVRTAGELGAGGNETEEVEAEIVEAEAVLVKIP